VIYQHYIWCITNSAIGVTCCCEHYVLCCLPEECCVSVDITLAILPACIHCQTSNITFNLKPAHAVCQRSGVLLLTLLSVYRQLTLLVRAVMGSCLRRIVSDMLVCL
jgi:hypothetical protein